MRYIQVNLKGCLSISNDLSSMAIKSIILSFGYQLGVVNAKVLSQLTQMPYLPVLVITNVYYKHILEHKQILNKYVNN